MTTTRCLNCDTPLVGTYCAGCGQKADTRRISLKQFVLTDILHGTFSIERGMLFTAKQALLRPGTAALEYIAGKRKRYYNLFLLALFLFGVILFLRHFYEVLSVAQGNTIQAPVPPNEASKRMEEFLVEQSKLIVFLFVPFAAVSSCVVFRRKKLNLSEHFILSGMLLLGILLLSALGNLFFYLTLVTDNDLVATLIDFGTPTLAVLYIGYGYWKAFAENYSRLGLLYRVVLLFLLLALQAYLLLVIIIGFVTDWRFGTVTFSHF